MSNNAVSVLGNIVKALAGVTFTTAATAYSAQGNPVMAGLTAFAAAGITAYDVIHVQVTNLHTQKQQDLLIELPKPSWWTSDPASWHGLCAEIVNYFPDIVQTMNDRLHQYQGQYVLTEEAVLHIFSDTLVDILNTNRFTWMPNIMEREKIAECIFIPLLEKLGEAFREEIKRIQYETALKDTHATAINTQKMVSLLEREHPQLSDEDVYDQCQQYCKKLYDQWRMLDFKGIKYADTDRPMSIPLNEVFILPDVQIGIPEYETLVRDDMLGGNDLKEEKQEKRQEYERKLSVYQDRKRVQERRNLVQRENFREVLAKHRRLVILGDPGSGKSTLLRYLMLALAESNNKFSIEFPQLASDAHIMCPLYIPLFSYAEAWLSHNMEDRSLKDFLPKHLRYSYLDAYVNAIQYRLEQGLLLIMLDGLDEIPDASLRMQIVRQIEIFSQAYPHNHFIVTSRIVGYKDAPLAAEYQPYTLADFSEDQIKAFAQKWCPAYEKWTNQVKDSQSLQAAATEEADKLFQATRRNEGVRRLSVNPLLLTILALIQRQGIELPSHRVELYDLCITTLLETWIKTKGSVDTTRFSKNELIKILRPLAFWMHDHLTVGAIPEEELLEQVSNQLLERRISQNEDEAQRLAEQFLQTVREKTGILIERGKHRYGFLHLTFEEYFAASELVIRKKDGEKFIKEHLHNPSWRVVILLAVGIIGILRNDEDGVTELVEKAILEAESSFEEWLHRDLLLAGLCLADDVGVSIACENAIIEQIIYLYLTIPYDSIRSSFSDTTKAWRDTRLAKKASNLVLSIVGESKELTDVAISLVNMSTPFSESQFGKELIAYCQRIFQLNRESHDRLMHLNLISAFCQLGNMTDEIQYILESLIDFDSNVQRAACRALGQLGNGQPQVIEALLQTLTDSNSAAEVRQAAANALGQLGSNQPQVIEALLQVLTDSDEEVQKSVVTTLGQLGSGYAQVTDALLKVLTDSYFEVRRAAANALGRLYNGDQQVIDTLLKALIDSNSSWPVRQAAVNALGQLGNNQPQVIEALLQVLTDSNSVAEVREAAVNALGQSGSDQPQVIEALLKPLANSYWITRADAAEALGQLGNRHPQVIEALFKTLNDLDSSVRKAAAKALGQLGKGHPQVIEALLQTLTYCDWKVQQAILTTMTELPISNLATVKFLEDALLKYKNIADRPFTDNSKVDQLLSFLLKIITEI